MLLIVHHMVLYSICHQALLLSAETCFLTFLLFLNVLTLQEARQEQVDQCVLQANALHYSYDWQVNDLALKQEPLSLLDKMKPEWSGPYPVEHVHANGTCMVWLAPNVTERLNIRQLKPFQAT